MNKISSRYISEIKSFFPLYGKNERKYLNNLKTTVIDYCEEEPINSINELYDIFGYPNEVVNSYFENMDTQVVIKKIKKSKHIKVLLSAIILSLFICTALHCFFLYEAQQVFKREEMVYAETIIH